MIMPMIQLIRRDGKIIELEATSVAFDVLRGVQVWPIPIAGVRAAFDMNDNRFSIGIKGILTDDNVASSAVGATAVLDLSRATGLYDSWFKQQQAQGRSTMNAITDALHGKEFVFKSSGQVTANLGENITLRFYQTGVPSATVATKSIIPVYVPASLANTEEIADAIVTALNAASVKVNTVTTAITSIFTISQSAGDKVNSGSHQGVGTLTGEKVTLTNIIKSADGNTPLTKQGNLVVSGNADWSHSFFSSASFVNGVSGVRMTRGDKVQDLLNMTVNASAGGGLINPQSFTGDLIEMPDSLASFDVGKLLRIDQAESVKKYIVGLRIPYESLISSNLDIRELRQFVIPTGPGTDFSAVKNTGAFDPVDNISGEIVRPNPYLRQGVAISGVVQKFTATYEAGDSVWNYDLEFAAAEQLLGI